MIPSHYNFDLLKGSSVHLGICGSVAAYKSLELLRFLIKSNVSVSATLTDAGSRFLTELSLKALGADPVHPPMFSGQEQVFAHLEPSQNCDILAIVPATANTIARITHGLADDQLACQALAFSGPILIAPAMNSRMWQAAATQQNIATLVKRGVNIIGPARGEMACRETGAGRLTSMPNIWLGLLKGLASQDLLGRTIMINLGPTREFFDQARFWSNPSSGKMGAALAIAAWLRGAEVQVVSGPTSSAESAGLIFPDQISVHSVTSARQMHAACLDIWPDVDTAVCSAAVADFRPLSFKGVKMAKSEIRQEPTFQFAVNPDIAADMGRTKKTGQTLIGFAAGDAELSSQMQSKLKRKNFDMIVGNRIDTPESGFAGDRNQVSILDRNGRSESWPHAPKTEIAWRIWDWISLI